MEKIELHKRTLRTLSLSELELIGGGGEDGDEDPDGSKPPDPTPPKPSTLSSDCPCFSVEVCPPKSSVCPPSSNLKCCPNSGD